MLSTLALALGGTGASLALLGTVHADNYNPTDCGGKQIVNVTYKLYNDADSGFRGNWAIDSLNRHMQIFDLGGGVYCETLNGTGSFITTGPLSPQNGSPLSAGIKGVVNGGYVTTDFTSTLNPTPDYATHGNLGSFDAESTHPSLVSYFTSYSGWDQPSWGWTYHTPKNGDWTNASTGSSGDVADN